MDLRHIPTVPIEFSSSTQSAGLELVDIHLWIFKRFLERKELAGELHPLIKSQMHRGRTDEISLDALQRRWGSWFDNLPEPTAEQMENAQMIYAIQEERRAQAMNAIPGTFEIVPPT